ncbi:hypothetical protein TPSD3_09270 [Thioflexithrix psekupsensis]|uniref:DUF4384 domain-containing protein n=2 Tax=Thioflexithrix psekupsensis TaxID=1570016 RepID=A0A251X926_9GAMM|nr:hypothetical protein TPSD3_09270 [Thioflexithrix psekupsensis]
MFLWFHSATTFAIVPAIALKALETLAISAASDAVVSYFSPDKTPEELNKVRQQLEQVKQQLAASKQASEYPSTKEFAQIEQLITQSDNILNAINSQMNSLEARVKLLENDITGVHQFIQQRQSTDPTPSVKQAAQAVEQAVQQASLQFDISYGYRPKHQGDIRPLTNNAILSSGDSYKITFTPKQDSYVYIFQIDGGDNVTRLFPMEKMGDVVVNNFNPVKANQTYHIPSPNQSFKLDNVTGTEKIYFIASQQQDIQLEQWNKQQPVVLAMRNLQQAIMTRGPAGIVDDPKQSGYHTMTTEEDNQFKIDRKHLMGLCQKNGCVNVLSFEHR